MSKIPKKKSKQALIKEYNVSLNDCEGTLDNLINMLCKLRDTPGLGGDAKVTVETQYGYYFDDPDTEYLKITGN